MVVPPTRGPRLSVESSSHFISFGFHDEIPGLDLHCDGLEGKGTEAENQEVAWSSSHDESRGNPGIQVW